MPLYDDIARALRAGASAVRGAWKAPAQAAAPAPSNGAPPHGARRLRQVPSLSEWDAEDVLAALRAHVAGEFRASAQLADHLGQCDAVAGVLDTLRRTVVGLPFDLAPPLDTPDPGRSTRLATELRRAWPRMLSRGAAAEIVKWSALMGFAIAERVWRLDPVTGRWSCRLKPWHPVFTRWDWTRGCFAVQTETGTEYVTPDSQKWCLFTDIEESRPWMSGAVRPLGILTLIAWWLDRDGARWSERHGLPPLGAKVPMSQSEGPRVDRFLSDLEDLGTEPIMRLPQGEQGAASFDIEWKELKNATAWQGFLEPGRDIRSRVAIVLVGQPLTSQAGVGGSGSYALGKVHSGVHQQVVESYAHLLGTARAHLVVPWVRVNETGSRRDAELIAPAPTWDAAPPADAKADAESSEARARAVKAWQETGVPVDALAEAKADGVIVLTNTQPKTSVPTGEVRALPERYDGIDLRPSQGMADAARRGIELHEEGLSGDGLKPETVKRAHQIAARDDLTPEHWREMRGWFARHASDRTPEWDSPPTPGYVAWMLWGGDPGESRSRAVVARLDRADEEDA